MRERYKRILYKSWCTIQR